MFAATVLDLCRFEDRRIEGKIGCGRRPCIRVSVSKCVINVNLPEFQSGSYRVRLMRIRNGAIDGCSEKSCRCWPGARHLLRRLDPCISTRSLLFRIAEILSCPLRDGTFADEKDLEALIEDALERRNLALCITRPLWDRMYGCLGAPPINLLDDLSELQNHKKPREDLRVQTQLPTAKPVDQTWIEFQLLDDKTEEPLVGVPFTILLPTGAEVTKSTDAEGVIRIDGVPPGVCDIKKITDDRGLEVIRVE